MYLLQHLSNVKNFGIVIILSMTWSIIYSDVHTSIGELVNVFKMEQELVISISKLCKNWNFMAYIISQLRYGNESRYHKNF